MSSDQPAEVTLTNSVVSFDGGVFELFGHASCTGNRIHLALVEKIEAAGDKIVITTEARSITRSCQERTKPNGPKSRR